MKDKMLAVGEIGLDYHGDEVDKGLQKEWFYRQLELAKELNKPVVIHSRDACEDTMTVLGSKEARGIRGVMHCYSYTVETARELINELKEDRKDADERYDRLEEKYDAKTKELDETNSNLAMCSMLICKHTACPLRDPGYGHGRD